MMSEKKNTLGKAVAVAAGVGAAYLALKKKENEKQVLEQQAAQNSNYRNTERGKYDKNSKGIYYTNGNYEAFARPEKPEGVDEKHAYIVGSGLAALSAACFLVRDGQMLGSHIHILEAMDIAGGACDGIFDPSRGYTSAGALEGLGKGFPSLIISVCRYVAVIIPVAFVMSRITGAVGVWHAFWITEVITSVISYI